MTRPALFRLGLLATGLAGAACGDAFFYGPEPGTHPEVVFETLWGEVDRHYAFFAEKGVDWRAVYAEYRPRVSDGMPGRELFHLLGEMLSVLRDGHVGLVSPYGSSAYDGWIRGTPLNYDPAIVTTYLHGTRRGTPGGRITFGRLGPETGYIHIRDFQGAGWVADIDLALAELEGVDRLVLDVRSNVGGSDLLSRPIAGRFADRRRLAQLAYYRDGPGYDDFADARESYVEPSGPRRFLGPIALLTNRAVFSTGESFVLHMRVLPHVLVVGDTTGGGAGNPINRELPNGWGAWISRWKATTPDGFSYEGIGLPPDIPVWIAPEDQARGRDTILERALDLLGIGR